jgi:hypothetical protein
MNSVEGFLFGFLGAVAGVLFVNWIAPWWYREQIRRQQREIDRLNGR